MIVRTDEQGLAQADRRLEQGAPVVVPLPLPRAYIVAGCAAPGVNSVKGRAADQTVGSAVADMSEIAPYIDLDGDTFAFARWLAGEEQLNLFLPVREDKPRWMNPSTSDGWAGIALASPGPVAELWKQRRHFYVSSANRTGAAVVTTAGEAEAVFGPDILVVDDGRMSDVACSSGSAAIVRVYPDRQLELVRHGVNDLEFRGDSELYIRTLHRRSPYAL